MYGISLWDRSSSYTARIRFDTTGQIQWWQGAGNFLNLQAFSTGTTYRIKIRIDTVGNNATVYINGVERTRNQPLNGGRAIQKWDNAVVGGGSALYYIDHMIIRKEVSSDLVSLPAARFDESLEEVNTTCSGTLTSQLINPTNNFEVQRGQNFTMSVNVTCIGGCCESVSATADPRLIETQLPTATYLLQDVIILILLGGMSVIFLIKLKGMR